ncbi:MAG: tyrosine-type recombinase/integrase [Proteobacteria bacterium]|nr:tyrosine-type recombinase/integrase [Pseudomonadota bacterium]
MVKSSGPYFIETEPLANEFNRFLSALSIRGLSAMTLRAYAYDLLTMYRWLLSTKYDVYALNQSNILDFIAYKKSLKSNPKSINRELVTIRQFFRFLTGDDLAPAAGSTFSAGHYKGRGMDKNLGLHRLKSKRQLNIRVKTSRTLVEPLNEEQVCAFLGTLRRYRDIAIVHLMLLCGLRSHEVLRLQTFDVDMIDHFVRVTGKGDKQRQLPIPSILIRSIGDYLELERPSNCAGSNLFVVLQGPRRGKAMTPAGLRILFRYRREHRGIPNANAHRFRHTFGADMARNGVRLPILQKMMGHANAVTTLGYINLSMNDITKEF